MTQKYDFKGHFNLEDKFCAVGTSTVGGDLGKVDILTVVALDHDTLAINGEDEEVEQGDGDDIDSLHGVDDSDREVGVWCESWQKTEYFLSFVHN